ncbi:UNKNOWN [Stylonychia lemnae]|uniref:Uncharacterized protein n=1 Tax=Stylonychia lemnae TaxID=5949 RepID=A0A078AH19_STYLE|nr:UNKNOWN [Stylonychia lemnae]|eukprot:CDW81570.1 UNKNOWN [Stylonychia lemnae]
MKDIKTVQRIANFDQDQLLEFRKRESLVTRDTKELQIGKQNIKYFYHYLQFSLINAVNENALNYLYPERQQLSDQDKLDIEAYLILKQAQKKAQDSK